MASTSAVRVGWLEDPDLVSVFGLDAYSPIGGAATAAEVFLLRPGGPYALQLRGSLPPGCVRAFCGRLAGWAAKAGFGRVVAVAGVDSRRRGDSHLRAGGDSWGYYRPTLGKDESDSDPALESLGWKRLPPAILGDKPLAISRAPLGALLCSLLAEGVGDIAAACLWASEGAVQAEGVLAADRLEALLGLGIAPRAGPGGGHQWTVPPSWAALAAS